MTHYQINQWPIATKRLWLSKWKSFLSNDDGCVLLFANAENSVIAEITLSDDEYQGEGELLLTTTPGSLEPALYYFNKIECADGRIEIFRPYAKGVPVSVVHVRNKTTDNQPAHERAIFGKCVSLYEKKTSTHQ